MSLANVPFALMKTACQLKNIRESSNSIFIQNMGKSFIFNEKTNHRIFLGEIQAIGKKV